MMPTFCHKMSNNKPENHRNTPLWSVITTKIAEASRVVQETGLTVRNNLSDAINRGATSLRADSKAPSPIKSVVIETADLLRDARRIDPVDPDSLPAVCLDKEEDRTFKRNTMDYLSTQMSIESPFHEAIELISKRAFDRGIHPDQLTAFFEAEDILNLLIRHVITKQYSQDRGPGVIASVLNSVNIKLATVHSRASKKKVEGDFEKEVLSYFKDFSEHYDPYDARYTVSQFIQKLEDAFPQYDLLNWFLENQHLFTKLLRGHSEKNTEDIDPEKCHVQKVVRTAYEKRAKEKGLQEQFINLYIPYFLEYKPATLDIARDVRKGSIPVEIPAKWILHRDQIVAFFQKIAPKIESTEVSKVHLRTMITEACLKKIFASQCFTVEFSDRNGKSHEEQEFSNFEELEEFAKEKIKSTAIVSTSYVELVNLLANPDSIPDELEKDYQRFYDDEGKLKTATYNKSLRTMFALVADYDQDGTPEKERMTKIKARLNEIFTESQGYLDHLHGEERGLGIPSPNDFPEVRASIDYAELVRLACRGETEEIRFAARQKIEIGWLIYICKNDAAFVFAEHEAKSFKLHLENSADGLNIDKTKPLSRVVFKKHISEDGGAQVEVVGIQDDDEDLLLNEEDLRTLKLIPGTIANQKCFLLTANHDNTDPYEYMDLKSVYSLITKLIRKRAKVENITDYSRMTIAVETIEELRNVLDYFKDNYLIFGQRVKVEVRGFEDAGLELDDLGVESNPHKGSTYRAVRMVVKVIIPDSSGKRSYLAKFELRIILLKDLLLEKMELDPLDSGHASYETRRQRGVMTIIQPQRFAPDLYKKVGPRPHDIFHRTSTELKKKTDFPNTASVAPSSPETAPSS